MTKDLYPLLCEKPGQSVRSELNKNISTISEEVKTLRESAKAALNMAQQLGDLPDIMEKIDNRLEPLSKRMGEMEVGHTENKCSPHHDIFTTVTAGPSQ